jgi:hypothetical protein
MGKVGVYSYMVTVLATRHVSEKGEDGYMVRFPNETSARFIPKAEFEAFFTFVTEVGG